MKQKEVIDTIRSRIVPLTQDLRILAIYLLGSAVDGQLRPDSDIDLAFMPEPGVRIGPLDRAEMGTAVSFDLGRDVDIGELSSENLIYSREALLKGIRLFSRDSVRTDLYAASLLGMYVRFNEDRRELTDAYRT
jgi:predicted nucleotidyltransferase